jgi:hypothetical protein
LTVATVVSQNSLTDSGMAASGADAPGRLGRLEAEEPVPSLLEGGHGGGAALAVADVLDGDPLVALLGQGGPQLVEAGHRQAGDGHDLVAGP